MAAATGWYAAGFVFLIIGIVLLVVTLVLLFKRPPKVLTTAEKVLLWGGTILGIVLGIIFLVIGHSQRSKEILATTR